MRKTTTAVLLFACVFMALADELSHKAYMFPPTNFGILLPSGFSRDKLPTQPGVWVFTNAVGSRLSFVIGRHPPLKGEKTDFKGFASLELKTNLLRQITFDSSGFSHAELEQIGKPPAYDAQLSYLAAHTNDQIRLDQSIESFSVQSKESNKNLEPISGSQ